MFKNKGILRFDPVDMTKKHLSQSSWKKTAILTLDCEIHAYYSWFLKKRFNLILNPPLRGTHVTVINDKIVTKEQIENYLFAKNKWDGKEIEFIYDIDPRSDGLHWWLRVSSDQIMDIRNDAKLGWTHWSLHLTLGRADHPLMEKHSEYILRLIRNKLIK